MNQARHHPKHQGLQVKSSIIIKISRTETPQASVSSRKETRPPSLNAGFAVIAAVDPRVGAWAQHILQTPTWRSSWSWWTWAWSCFWLQVPFAADTGNGIVVAPRSSSRPCGRCSRTNRIVWGPGHCWHTKEATRGRTWEQCRPAARCQTTLRRRPAWVTRPCRGSCTQRRLQLLLLQK